MDTDTHTRGNAGMRTHGLEDTWIHGHTDTCTYGHTDTGHTDTRTHTHTQTHRHTDLHIHRHTDTQIHRHKQPGDLDNSDNLDNLDTIWTIQTITFGFFASTTTFGFFASTASRCPPHAFHEPSAGLDGTVDGASGGVCLSQLDLPVCTIVQRTCAEKATCACDLISIAHWSY